MIKKYIIPLLLISVLTMGGCGGNNTDNTPSPSATQTTGEAGPAPTEVNETGVVNVSSSSEPDEHGSSAELSISWDGDTITNVVWKEYSNGELKDENYGKDLDEGLYESAQNALKGSATYPEQLLEKQDIDKVDAVSGATTSYETFKQLYADCAEKK